MKDTQFIGLKLEKELLDKINQSRDSECLSEFIRNCIKHRLKLLKNSVEDYSDLLKKVETLNLKNTENKVADSLIKLQLIYEELKKQNEILKRQNEILMVTYRRVTLGASFSADLLDDLKKTQDYRKERTKRIIETIANELIEFNLTESK